MPKQDMRITVVSATVGVAALGIATLGIAGTAAAPARAAEPVKITVGWIPPDITGVFKTATNFFEAGAKQANEHGFDVTVLTHSPSSHTAFADQVAIIEDMIQRRVDVLAISPSEVEVIKPALAEAAEHHIPVIIVNLLEPIPDATVASYIGFDNTQAAEVSAYAVLNYLGGPGVVGAGPKVDVKPGTYLDLAWWQNVYKDLSAEERAKIKGRGAIIEGIAGGFFSTARLNGFKQVLSQFPGVQIISTCAADWNREKGTRCAEDMLQANPQGLDFVWAASNEMGLGAMLAAESAGRLQTADQKLDVGGKNVAVFMNDLTPESVDRIAEGKIIAETTHGFADWGWYGASFAVQLACGLDAPKTFDIRPRTAYIENARQFYPNPALPEVNWDAIRADCKKK
jgi:ribose transport system substrate-binding protein